jgi:hypothetical protein
MTPDEATAAVAEIPRLLRGAPRWLVWPAILLALVAEFSAGRFSGPAIETEHTEYLEVVKVKWKTTKARDVVRYIERSTSPDGTKLEKISERIATKTDTALQEDRSVADVRTKTAENLPAWRLGILAGGTWKEPALRLAGPLVVGAVVEHRLIGGVSLGAWGTTQGVLGVSASLELP